MTKNKHITIALDETLNARKASAVTLTLTDMDGGMVADILREKGYQVLKEATTAKPTATAKEAIAIFGDIICNGLDAHFAKLDASGERFRGQIQIPDWREA